MMLLEQHSSQTRQGRMKKKCRTIIEGNAKKAEDLARRHGENAAADLAKQIMSEESLI